MGSMRIEAFKILVATAAENVRSALATAVERSRLEVAISYVADGEAAVASLVTGKWGCAVVDAALFDADACEVVRELRDNRVKTPIVVLSAAIGEPEVAALIEAGASDCFDTAALSQARTARAFAGAIRVCWAEHQTISWRARSSATRSTIG